MGTEDIGPNMQDFSDWTYRRVAVLHKASCSYCGKSADSYLQIGVPQPDFLAVFPGQLHRLVRYCPECEERNAKKDAALAMFAVQAQWDLEG